MRIFLKIIVVLSMLIGMHSRTFAVDPCDFVTASNEHEHHHDHHAPCHSHDEQCPADHHHHHGAGCFCSAMPMTDQRDHVIQLLTPRSSLSRMQHERRSIPDGPFLSEDKPPVI
jgi:hypothetical protein